MAFGCPVWCASHVGLGVILRPVAVGAGLQLGLLLGEGRRTLATLPRLPAARPHAGRTGNFCPSFNNVDGSPMLGPFAVVTCNGVTSRWSVFTPQGQPREQVAAE